MSERRQKMLEFARLKVQNRSVAWLRYGEVVILSTGSGKNSLGKILQEVREKLKKEWVTLAELQKVNW